MLPAAALLVSVLPAFGCAGTVTAPVVNRVADQPPVSTATLEITKLFGMPGYNYAPSIIAAGDVRQVWWCGYGAIPGTAFQTDVIYYRAINVATGEVSPTQTVFWPQQGQWDGRYTCDPSVIRGQFRSGGQSYGYALYYTATDRDDGTNNRIGVAFSNDGVNWVRYAQNPVIYPENYPTATYGAGQAATCNRDGLAAIVLFHTDLSGAGVLVRTSTDGINFGAPTALPQSGTTLVENNDFAYDPQADTFYGAVEFPVIAGDRESSAFGLYRITAGQLFAGTGSWEQLGTVDPATTGAHLNHSPGLVRDGFGNLDPQHLEAYFSEGTNDPSTWTLYSARWK